MAATRADGFTQLGSLARRECHVVARSLSLAQPTWPASEREDGGAGDGGSAARILWRLAALDSSGQSWPLESKSNGGKFYRSQGGGRGEN